MLISQPTNQRAKCGRYKCRKITKSDLWINRWHYCQSQEQESPIESFHVTDHQRMKSETND